MKKSVGTFSVSTLCCSSLIQFLQCLLIAKQDAIGDRFQLLRKHSELQFTRS